MCNKFSEIPLRILTISYTRNSLKVLVHNWKPIEIQEPYMGNLLKNISINGHPIEVNYPRNPFNFTYSNQEI